MLPELSLLKPLDQNELTKELKGYQRNRKCGYCKTTEGSCSYYIDCELMRVDHYEELIKRGWRRSGTTYYKPDLAHSCCPHYTIRLHAESYKPKKDQRRCINRWNDRVFGLSFKRKAAMLTPITREAKRRTRDVFNLPDAVHKSEYSNINRPKDKKLDQYIEPSHQFEVTLEPAKFTEEKHSVFLKYQIEIHKDPPSRWGKESFKRFLCDGLDTHIMKVGDRSVKVGSYHHCYRLDGRLVAVGVLDLLPYAVSSVYLFYDPEFQDAEFGKMSAVREIALTIEGKYEWYYMGYYIHSCTKMRYKGSFSPSYLLDPVSLGWNLLSDDLRLRLDQHKYVCPSQDSGDGYTSTSQPRLSSHDDKSTLVSTPARAVEATPIPTPDTNDYDIDSEPSDADDNDIPEGSLFDYCIPGVLTKSEVSKLDLDHWKLLIRSTLVDFEDIVGWEDQCIDDPSSLKGIVAELAAATGPKLLSHSAVKIF